MAIEGAAATVPLSPGERLNGLNHIAELRAKVFGLNIESELERFIKDMRDPRDINNEQNKRALAAIFFMAKIPAERHSISINELTTDEKRYEPATGRWYVRGIKSMVIEAADNITMKTSEFVLEADRTRINSEVVINGGVTQGGGAMSSNGIVVDAHQHTGVLKGGDTTGGPV